MVYFCQDYGESEWVQSVNGYPGIGPEYQIPDELVGKRIELLLPPAKPKKKAGRPAMDARRAMTALFCILRTGCQWNALPRSRRLRDGAWSLSEMAGSRRVRADVAGRANAVRLESGHRVGMASDGWRHDQGSAGGKRHRPQLG